jgi:hypothetical protein
MRDAGDLMIGRTRVSREFDEVPGMTVLLVRAPDVDNLDTRVLVRGSANCATVATRVLSAILTHRPTAPGDGERLQLTADGMLAALSMRYGSVPAWVSDGPTIRYRDEIGIEVVDQGAVLWLLHAERPARIGVTFAPAWRASECHDVITAVIDALCRVLATEQKTAPVGPNRLTPRETIRRGEILSANRRHRGMGRAVSNRHGQTRGRDSLAED